MIGVRYYCGNHSYHTYLSLDQRCCEFRLTISKCTLYRYCMLRGGTSGIVRSKEMILKAGESITSFELTIPGVHSLHYLFYSYFYRRIWPSIPELQQPFAQLTVYILTLLETVSCGQPKLMRKQVPENSQREITIVQYLNVNV